MAKAAQETKVSRQKGGLKKSKTQSEHSDKSPAVPLTGHCKAADSRSSIAGYVKPKVPRVAVNVADNVTWWLVFTAVAGISLGSRLYKIAEPHQVWWVVMQPLQPWLVGSLVWT